MEWWRDFLHFCFHTWLKPKHAVLLVSSPASVHSWSFVIGSFTAQIKSIQTAPNPLLERKRTQRREPQPSIMCALMFFSWNSVVAGHLSPRLGGGITRRLCGTETVFSDWGPQHWISGSQNDTFLLYRLLSPDTSFSVEHHASFPSPFHWSAGRKPSGRSHYTACFYRLTRQEQKFTVNTVWNSENNIGIFRHKIHLHYNLAPVPVSSSTFTSASVLKAVARFNRMSGRLPRPGSCRHLPVTKTQWRVQLLINISSIYLFIFSFLNLNGTQD